MTSKNMIFSIAVATALMAVGLAGLFNAAKVPEGSYEIEIENSTYAEIVSCFGIRASIPITNVNELQDMNSDLNGSYYLANDIDTSATRTWNWNGSAFEGFNPIGNATGYPGSGDWNNAFNGTFDGKGHKINGLHINRPSRDCVGLFGAMKGDGIIRNVSLENVNISGKGFVGGLVGQSDVLIEMSCTNGSVNGSDLYVGGLAGATWVHVNNTYSTCSVGGTGNFFGGLVGHPFANISNSYAAGCVGTAPLTGGLFAQNYGVTTSCYWDMEISGRVTSDGGTGKTTAEMMLQATFAGWDFSNVWAIDEGISYPYLGGRANNAPIITTSDITSVVNGTAYNVDYDANDLDVGDMLTWSLKTNAIWLSVNATTGILSGTPAYVHNGTYWVNVTVADANGGGDSRNFSITVMGDFDGDGTTDDLDDDDDNDGLPDTFETSNALDPRNRSDGSEDPDSDGLTNLEEYLNNTQPNDNDTDDDGMPDSWEVEYRLQPTLDDSKDDPDGEGLTNLEEYLNNTRPNDNDTDDDGMPDNWEVEYRLQPTLNDSEDDPDGDGYSNLEEFREGTDPRNPDSHPASKKAGEEKTGTLWWIYIIIIIFIVVVIVILLLLLSRKKKKDEPERGTLVGEKETEALDEDRLEKK